MTWEFPEFCEYPCQEYTPHLSPPLNFWEEFLEELQKFSKQNTPLSSSTMYHPINSTYLIVDGANTFITT